MHKKRNCLGKTVRRSEALIMLEKFLNNPIIVDNDSVQNNPKCSEGYEMVYCLEQLATVVLSH